MTHGIHFAFFGTSHIATMVLDELENEGLLPALVITMPPRTKGRGLKEIPTEVEVWARERRIPVEYDWSNFEQHPPSASWRSGWDVAVIVDYGKILPASLLAIPKKGFLNVHPSLLPRFRGASPMRSAILADEKDTGVSIILVDDKMDHGPIVAQKKISFTSPPVGVWPLRNSDLEKILLPLGGALLARILPEYIAGNIDPVEQNHDVATYCKKFSKEDGLLDLSGDARTNLLKVRAFETWPGTYAYFERPGRAGSGKRIRVSILDGHIEGTRFVPSLVKPEGKNEMSYVDFLRSGAKPI